MAIESTDPKAIIDAINAEITNLMNEQVLPFVKTYLAARVHTLVYARYDLDETNPNSYKRRKENGGLADKDMYYELDDPGGSNEHTIRIADPRPEVAVVESGEGYDWLMSRIYHMQPFPRPYFSKVDEEIQDNTALIFGVLEARIASL